MQVGKGDIRSQRQRRRDRYRGCRVCGACGGCSECVRIETVVAAHDLATLALVVDGSFVESSGAGLGHGGAGLVLVLVQDFAVLASRACGFRTEGSADAELQAVIRAARWVSGVAIYTDARELPAKIRSFNPRLAVHYLDPGDHRRRSDAYVLAHRLSVEGRCRDAPQTMSPAGIEFVTQRVSLTKNQRKVSTLRRSVALLLEHARNDPAFDGDFAAVAAKLGWASGSRWQHNPAIRLAAARWNGGEEDAEEP
jgi:hypothetical protein